jgi:hypothetical protein
MVLPLSSAMLLHSAPFMQVPTRRDNSLLKLCCQTCSHASLDACS